MDVNVNDNKKNYTTTTATKSTKHNNNKEDILQISISKIINPKIFYTKPIEICYDEIRNLFFVDFLSLASSSSQSQSTKDGNNDNNNNDDVIVYDHSIIERLFYNNNNDSNGIITIKQWDKLFRDYEKRINNTSSTTNKIILQQIMSIIILSSNSLLQLYPILSTSFYKSIFRLLVYHPLLFFEQTKNNHYHPFKSCIKLLQDCLIECYNKSINHYDIYQKILDELHFVLVEYFEKNDINDWNNNNSVIRIINTSLWFWNYLRFHTTTTKDALDIDTSSSSSTSNINSMVNVQFPINFMKIYLQCISLLYNHITTNKEKHKKVNKSNSNNYLLQRQLKNIKYINNPLDKEDITYYNLHNNNDNTDTIGIQIVNDDEDCTQIENHKIFNKNKPKGIIGAISTKFNYNNSNNNNTNKPYNNEIIFKYIIEKYFYTYNTILNKCNNRNDKLSILHSLIDTMFINKPCSIQRFILFLNSIIYNDKGGISIYMNRIWYHYITNQNKNQSNSTTNKLCDDEYLLRIYVEIIIECQYYNNKINLCNALQPLIQRVVLLYKDEKDCIEIYLLLRAIGCIFIYRQDDILEAISSSDNNNKNDSNDNIISLLTQLKKLISNDNDDNNNATATIQLWFYLFPSKEQLLADDEDELLYKNNNNITSTLNRLKYEKECLAKCLYKFNIITKKDINNNINCNNGINDTTQENNFSLDPWPFHTKSTLRYTFDEKLKNYHSLLPINTNNNILFTKCKLYLYPFHNSTATTMNKKSDVDVTIHNLLNITNTTTNKNNNKNMNDWKHYIYQDEIIVYIFSFLNGDELIKNVINVCPKWDMLVQSHSKLWFDIFQQKWPDSLFHILTPISTMNQYDSSNTTIKTTTTTSSATANAKSNNKAIKRSSVTNTTTTNKNNYIIKTKSFKDLSY